MAMQTVTLHLPEETYRRLHRMARATQRPLEEVAVQSIQGNLPPSVDDLPNEWRDELLAMQFVSDTELWRVVKELLPAAHRRRHTLLLRKNREGGLTNTEQAELSRLRTATDRYVFRRSYALALLKWRGHTIQAVEK